MEIRYLQHYKYKYPKPTKYKSKSCFCIAQHWHQSIKESDYCNQLYMMKKNGDIKDYEIQKKFELRVNNIKICSIIPDFLVWDKDGCMVVHEVKAKITMTPVWNVKRKLFEACYPQIPYIVVK